MRKYRSFILLLCVLFTLQLNCVIVSAQEQVDTTVTAGSHSIDAAVPYLGVAQITENIQAAILYEVNSDTLMYAHNADTQTFPSSLVKIVTALLAVENGNLEDVITVSEAALSSVPYYAASAELQVGEQITLNDLLYCMMVGSANDAAAVIAEHIGGSQDGFVDKMNARAQELGCVNTNFVNPHGLHDEQQYTTVRDMARILSVAVKNSDFDKYFSAVTYNVPATNMSEERELSSGNHLMNTDSLEIYYDPRVTGGRTGIADDGTRCLASTAENNGMELICIVVGSESTFAEDGNTQTYGSFKETSLLLDAGFNGYKVVQVIYEDQALVQRSVVNGANDAVLAATSSVYSVLPEDISVDSLRYEYLDNAALEAPVEKGKQVSTLQVWFGNTCIAQSDLVSMNDVATITAAQDSTNNDARGAGKVVVIVLLSLVGAVIFAVIVLFAIRYFRVIQLKSRRKRYSRSRRRSR